MSGNDEPSETTAHHSGLAPPWPSSFRWGVGWTVFDGVALAVILATFWLLGGFWGAIGWVLVTILWALFPPVITVAAGQFILVAITPAEASLVATLLGVGAVSGLLLADIAESPSPVIDGLILVVLVVGIGTGCVLLGRTAGLFAGAVALVTLVGVSSYMCHRYLLLQLGLVANEPETSQMNRAGTAEAE